MSYTFDPRQRMTQISSGGTVAHSFKYDAFGRRISKTIYGTTTTYLYDGMNPVQETQGGTVSGILNGLGIDERYARSEASGQRYFLTDALGSTVALTDANASVVQSYAYGAYGNVTSSGSSTNSYQYTGRENDTNGFYYYRARYYAVGWQRFLSYDPAGLAGSMNRYVYVDANPVAFIDPFGMRSLTDREKRLLAPYIPQLDLNAADVTVGEMPWYAPGWAAGITRGNKIFFRDPNKTFCTNKDLANLAHELVHVGQYRNGMTWPKYLLASRHGYEKNPYEKTAFDLEDKVESELELVKCTCD